MSNTLIIWNEVPETVVLYVVPNDVIEKNGWAKYLEEAHGRLINLDDETEGMSFLSAAVTQAEHKGDPDFFPEDMDVPEEWQCALAPYKVEVAPGDLLEANITRVCYSGFVL